MIKLDADKCFPAKEWTELPASNAIKELSPLGIWESDYSLIFIVHAKTVDSIHQYWIECQEHLFKTICDEESRQGKDAYLLFLITEIPDNEMPKIEEMVNDTQIARKICIEVGNRTITDALQDSGLITTPLKEIGPAPFDSSIDKTLDRRMLQDLATKSLESIVENLLDGKYKDKDRDSQP